MKFILPLLAALVLCGCSSITGERTASDGTSLKIRSRRALWASEGIKATTKDSKGFEFSLTVSRSGTDTEALGAIAEGVTRGLK